MKVTTELKRLITAAFEKKNKDYLEARQIEAKVIYEGKIAEVESSDAFKSYVKACNELYEYLKTDYEVVGGYPSYRERIKAPYYYLNLGELLKPRVKRFIEDYSSQYVKYDCKCPNYEVEKDALLVKLTYEKDLDQIRQLLRQYDIEI